MALIPAYKIVNSHFTTQPTIGLLYGEHGIFATATLIASEIIKRYGKIVFIDGANRVDPFYLSKLARYNRITPTIFLQNAFVSRAFTCYQLEWTVTEGLRPFLVHSGARTLFLYGIIDLMDDDQVPIKDVFTIMKNIRDKLFQLKNDSISTLIVSRIPHFQLKEREKLFESIKRIADVKYRLEQQSYQHIIIEGIGHGKNNANSYNDHSIRRSAVVKLPEGSQKRGSRYLR